MMFDLNDLLVLHVCLNTGLATGMLTRLEDTVRLSAATNGTQLILVNFKLWHWLLSYLVCFKEHQFEMLDK